MPIWALSALGWLKGLPWQVYAGLFLLAAFPITYCKGVHDGREEVLTELREKSDEAKQKAEAARQIADEGAQNRADEFEAKQEVLTDAIEQAETNGGNALDAIFGDGL
jgi:ABC-type transporter MlaC component